MTLILVRSPKGGVGRTTVVAGLAVALARHGHAVTAVDLDPQDSLKLHFGGLPGGDRPETAFGVSLPAMAGSDPVKLMQGMLADDGVVIADLPAHDAGLADALVPMAGLDIVVFLADAGSMAMLPRIAWSPRSIRLLNQFDGRKRLSRDAMQLLVARGEAKLAVVRRDEAASEALATLCPLSEYAPASAVAADFERLAAMVESLAGLDRPNQADIAAA